MSPEKQQKTENTGENREYLERMEVDAPPADVAQYVADMVLELRNMAKDNKLEFLAYLLEMAYQEAFDLSQQKKQGDG